MYRDAAVRWQTQLADSLFVGVCVMLVTCVACALRFNLLGRRLSSCPRWDSIPSPSLLNPWPMVYVRPLPPPLSLLLGRYHCSLLRASILRHLLVLDNASVASE